MARNVKTLTITAAGRDRGKVFVLTEMSAMAAEKWAARAVLALARSGVDVPANLDDMGMMGVAILGVRAFAGAEYEDVAPLLDEMMLCVTYKPDPTQPLTRALIDDDVEEIATLLELRREVMELHVNFSDVAGWWKSRRAAADPESPASSDTPTSGQ